VATRRALRVLVVDDCRDQVDSLALLLTLWGHQALVAADGPSAFEMALAHRPDMVILDLGLPGGMDGYEVARRLRACPPTATTLLVALTGYSQDQDRQQALDVGFDHFLVKPSDPQELKKLLDGYAGFTLEAVMPDQRRGSVRLGVTGFPAGGDNGRF
jgi:CheY-like chemotaxis protein